MQDSPNGRRRGRILPTVVVTLRVLVVALLADGGRIDPVDIAIEKIPGISLNVRKYVFLPLESLDFFKPGKKDGLQPDAHGGDPRKEFSVVRKKIKRRHY